MKFQPLLATSRFALLAGALAASFSTTTLAAPEAVESRFPVHAGAGYGAPEMDLGQLEQRVRNTNAISVFQKLALKKEVDDLLVRFRSAHSTPNAEVAVLRRPYERLIANLQARLGRDPELAGEISASREAIWNALTDRRKFAAL